jgi:hypothetical protein
MNIINILVSYRGQDVGPPAHSKPIHKSEFHKHWNEHYHIESNLKIRIMLAGAQVSWSANVNGSKLQQCGTVRQNCGLIYPRTSFNLLRSHGAR